MICYDVCFGFLWLVNYIFDGVMSHDDIFVVSYVVVLYWVGIFCY